jgi:hypothetical protein
MPAFPAASLLVDGELEDCDVMLGAPPRVLVDEHAIATRSSAISNPDVRWRIERSFTTPACPVGNEYTLFPSADLVKAGVA